jgi:hypothetical protein
LPKKHTFHEEDWLRLSTYSSSEFQKNNFLEQKVSNLSPSIIAYHYLNQIVLDSIISTQDEFPSIAGNLITECLESIHKSSGRNSVITEFIIKLKEENHSKEKELQIERALNQEKVHFSNNLKAENEYLRSKILSIQNSLSWKLLTPVRRIQKRFRKESPKPNKTEPGFMDQVNQNADKLSLINSVTETTSYKKVFDWIIPDFNIGSGGHTTIFRIISWLEKFGYQNNIWVCGNSIHKSPEDAKQVIEDHFFQLKAKVHFLKKDKVVNLSSSGLICTSYHTLLLPTKFFFQRTKILFCTRF